MKSIIVVLFLLLAAPALAATSDAKYLIVVGATAPASDVVLGANFAASMKANTGITFTSAIDTDAYASITSLAGKTIIVINGKEKRIKILGSNSQAAQYFREQGFSVAEIASPVKEDLLLQTPVPATKPAVIDERPEEAPDTQDEKTPEPQEQDVPQEPAKEPEKPLLQPKDSEPVQDEPMPEVLTQSDTPGLFSRIWGWFAGLF